MLQVRNFKTLKNMLDKAKIMQNQITLIGDVHGKLTEYHKIVQSKKSTIALGDFGFKKEHDWHLKNVDNKNHKVLFGNHDYFPYIDFEHSLGRFGFDSDNSLFWISGADSIDKHWRTRNIDWFEDEQLDFKQELECFDIYTEAKPNVIISHDCPQFVRSQCFGIYDESLTSKFLAHLFYEYKPKMWIFGHHHKSIDIEIDGCRFVCLKELECFDVDFK